MELEIRKMRDSEALEVQKLGRRAFLGLEGIFISKPKTTFVAVIDNKIVGAAAYKFINTKLKNMAYIDFAFVDPKYHTQHIGTKLYKATIDYLRDQNCDALTALVKEDNVGSWKLLLNNGFKKVSFSQGVRSLGLYEMIKQFFLTPYCIAIGMNFYLYLKDEKISLQENKSSSQIGLYLITNLILSLLIIFGDVQNKITFILAYLMFLITKVAIGFSFTRLNNRNWKFHMNNCGGLMCIILNMLGSVLTLTGNWYPESYEKTDKFRKDIGIIALAEWILTLTFYLISAYFINKHIFFKYLLKISGTFLIYTIIILYPFESYGGKRVYDWNKFIYGFIAILSIIFLTLL